jgi:hypothetical protein
MSLRAGSIDSFGNTMASAIEDAFAAELWALKGITLPEGSQQERRMLFCAIAQGVLGYLAANEASLKLDLDPPYDVETGHVHLDYGGA